MKVRLGLKIPARILTHRCIILIAGLEFPHPQGYETSLFTITNKNGKGGGVSGHEIGLSKVPPANFHLYRF